MLIGAEIFSIKLLISFSATAPAIKIQSAPALRKALPLSIAIDNLSSSFPALIKYTQVLALITNGIPNLSLSLYIALIFSICSSKSSR